MKPATSLYIPFSMAVSGIIVGNRIFRDKTISRIDRAINTTFGVLVGTLGGPVLLPLIYFKSMWPYIYDDRVQLVPK